MRATGFNERLEEALGRLVLHRLGVPLNADDEIPTRRLDSFDDAVGRPGDGAESAAELVGGLVVKRVHD
jgi:hypothetical protein